MFESLNGLYCLMSLGLMVIVVWFGWAMARTAARADRRTKEAMRREEGRDG